MRYEVKTKHLHLEYVDAAEVCTTGSFVVFFGKDGDDLVAIFHEPQSVMIVPEPEQGETE